MSAASRYGAGPTRVLAPRGTQEIQFWGLLLSVATVAIWASSAVVGYVAATKALTLIGFMAAALGLVRPAVGILGIGILAALDAFSRVYVLTGGILAWNSFNYFLLLALVLLVREARRLWSVQTLLAGLLALLMGLELLFSSDQLVGLQHILGLVAVFGLVLYSDRAADQPEAWVWLGLVTGILGAGGGLVYMRYEADMADMNKNAWAYQPLTALLLICLSLTIAADRPRWRAVLLGLAAINFGWVFLSASRGTFLVALVAAAYLVFISVKGGEGARGRSWAALAGVVLAGLAAVFVLSLFSDRTQDAVDRMARLFDEDRSVANRTSGRSDLARIGWEIFRDHPFGIGTGDFATVAADYGAIENVSVLHGGRRELQAHSAWVKTIAENGAPGALLLFALVASFAWTGWARRSQGVFPLGLLASLVLFTAFLSTEFQAKGIWLFAAAVVVVLRRGRVREIRRARPVAAVVVDEVPDEWMSRTASASR